MKLFGREQWSELWYTLRSNKRRSLATSLGVFAGMFIFTLLVGLGRGISNGLVQSMEGITSTALAVTMGRTTMPYQGYKANREITPTYSDYLLAKQRGRQIENVAAVNAYNSFFAGTTVTANNKSFSTQVMGLDYTFITIIQQNKTIYGRNLRASDIADGLPVCLVGEKEAKKFFGNAQSALGQYLAIDGISFRIVGVVQPYSDTRMSFDINQSVQIPIKYVIKNDPLHPVVLFWEPKKGVTQEEAKEEMFALLAERHHVDPRDTEAFAIMQVSKSVELFATIEKGILILIWIAGLGTLISGVIGVSNILLVTVRERQREIGVRRAIGAKPKDIVAQFMAEAIAIIFVAGMAGMVWGMLHLLLVDQVISFTKLASSLPRPYPTPRLLLFSLMIMAVSGILAGLLPVQQALKIKAIDAIRDE